MVLVWQCHIWAHHHETHTPKQAQTFQGSYNVTFVLLVIAISHSNDNIAITVTIFVGYSSSSKCDGCGVYSAGCATTVARCSTPAPWLCRCAYWPACLRFLCHGETMEIET